VDGIAVIGIGKLGGAFALGLHDAGLRVEELIVRDRRIASAMVKEFLPSAKIVPFKTLSQISSDVVIIATDDGEIANVVSKIAPIVRAGQCVFHTSGSQSSEILDPLRQSGVFVGSIHPLTSVSEPVAGARQFRGTYFCLEGDTEAVKLAEKLVRKCGGLHLTIEPSSKPIYHAAAVMSAGHVTALFDAAAEMMSLAGVGSNEALKILLPLIGSAASNLKRQTPESALTGPFSRLDIETFKRHVASFGGVVPDDLAELYLDLGERSLSLVARRDGETEELANYRKAILMARRKLR
jgi:predicted short-subunit dehydrogenase-like oxidoreductase (DUF2520 family)